MRFEFTSGAQRGSHLMLYPRCLVHRSESHLETVPLARIDAIKVSFDRDTRRLGWGIACVVVALILLIVSAPLEMRARWADVSGMTRSMKKRPVTSLPS